MYTRNMPGFRRFYRLRIAGDDNAVAAELRKSRSLSLFSKGFERHSQEQANGRILNAELFAGERYVGIINR